MTLKNADLLTITDVMTLVGFKQAAIYKRIVEQKFPKPFRCGKRNAWTRSSIDEYLKAREKRQIESFDRKRAS